MQKKGTVHITRVLVPVGSKPILDPARTSHTGLVWRPWSCAVAGLHRWPRGPPFLGWWRCGSAALNPVRRLGATESKAVGCVCVCVCRPFGLKFLSQIDVYIANLGR